MTDCVERTRRAGRCLGLLPLLGLWACGGSQAAAPVVAPAAPGPPSSVVGSSSASLTVILGRPTDRSLTVNVRADSDLELYLEHGRAPGSYAAATATARAAANQPVELGIGGLAVDTRYYYRVRHRRSGSSDAYAAGEEHSFTTQRAPGSTFRFAAQGDSHPERPQSMFNADLYIRTLKAVAADQPDFYLTSGDDFSVDTLRTVNAETVAGRYTLQLPYLALVAHSSPLFLVNGNHEQAARYLYDADGPSRQVPVWAQNARNAHYPQPAPDGFYSGNTETVPGIGLLRNYYAWEWGDALFVTLDPYWSSPVAVANVFGDDSRDAGGGPNDRWEITHGAAQYQWLKQTLETSRARWKFVFAHHVLGTGRGAVEVANLYEWGGSNNNGTPGFAARRPGWPLPIHQLLAANKVTIFFQGHDHLFAHQQLDGVAYQELPNPADNTYTAFNADAYRSGDRFPNAGYVRVTVSPLSVLVEYVRIFLPQDEAPPSRLSGMVQFAYTITR